jgi:hypothetical protein
MLSEPAVTSGQPETHQREHLVGALLQAPIDRSGRLRGGEGRRERRHEADDDQHAPGVRQDDRTAGWAHCGTAFIGST